MPQGPLICGTGADDNATGTIAWSNPTRITVDDGSSASIFLQNGDVSHYIKASNFSFTIPGGAVVSGITVTVSRTIVGGSADIQDNRVRIVKGGVIGATDKSVAGLWAWNSGVLYTTTFGGSSDLWGETWTPADINDATFGFVYSVKSTDSGQGLLDYVKITINYTDASGAAHIITNRGWAF